MTVNLPVFVYGASIGWISPMTLLLQSKDSPTGRPLTDTEISWIAALPYLMSIPANYLMAFMGDCIGRKLTLIFMSIMGGVCWIIKLSSLSMWAFILARAAIGVSCAGAYVTCPLYTKEISQDTIRGFLGTLVILFHTSGNLFLYIIGDILSYNTVLWVCLSLPTIHLALFLMMPESPSYLMRTGKEEEAKRVLGWLRCRSADDVFVRRELQVIKDEQTKDESSSNFILKAVLSDKILFRAFRIAVVVSLAREVCGSVPVLNFAGDIFSMAAGSGLVLTPNQQAMALGAVQVAGSALASIIVEKAGRKPLLFSTSLVSGLSMGGLATFFLVRSLGISAPSWLPIFTLCLCIFCDAAGLQPVSVILTSEIFSFKYRGTVMATTMSMTSLSDFFQMLFFKPLATTVGAHVAFYFFSLVCLLAALYVILVVPETKTRSLSEIYLDLRTKKEKALDESVNLDKLEA
ncbi:facilitated trehalose transporter Tret1-like isoform X2 [Leguminivora glycinivorella]|uniref:facilitated trehalose transporter Tret1-like isoform X2 n=1 Tax=Leguminivora glycinivorella TaxID=1035111 RepID=UPI00200F5E8C|nr:facilitated trehalose transporter Tret1-like isoform X2 [Leguminivora glycinivorella]